MDTEHFIKALVSLILGSLIAASCSSCGFTTGSTTIGTTSYLQEVNRVKLARIKLVVKDTF